MTTTELRVASALTRCRFLPGSFDKRFVNQLSNWIDRDMTEAGKRKMIELLHKYRRQIPNYKELCTASTETEDR